MGRQRVDGAGTASPRRRAARRDGTAAGVTSLVQRLGRKVVGQSAAVETVAPYVLTHAAGLAPHGRPVGIFLLLGPTGTGKTRTAEALAEVLHGTSKALLRIDCGEYQSDHEVAKLIGAPPGYLGHRETKPALIAERLQAVTSSACDLSIVLFDEIEKAAPALTTLLLGILDQGRLRLGDNSEVSFETSVIFLTSNLGAREMMHELHPGIGFSHGRTTPDMGDRLHAIGLAAMRRRFSPEFVNRIDAVATYQPLDAAALGAILDQQVRTLQEHLDARLGERSFSIDVTEGARQYLLATGTSPEYGARELKRVIHRELSHRLAALVHDGRAQPGSRVRVDVGDGAPRLIFQVERGRRRRRRVAPAPTVLVVDAHGGLREWLDAVLGPAGFRTLLASSSKDALDLAARSRIDAALVGQALPDGGDGIRLAIELRARQPGLPIGLMLDAPVVREQEAACRDHGFPLLPKPFLAQDAIALLRAACRPAADTPPRRALSPI